MNSTKTDDCWPHPDFYDNWHKKRQEDLSRYAGQHIAWSWDGSRVLAAGADRDEVLRKLEAAGENSSRVVFDYIDPITEVQPT